MIGALGSLRLSLLDIFALSLLVLGCDRIGW